MRKVSAQGMMESQGLHLGYLELTQTLDCIYINLVVWQEAFAYSLSISVKPDTPSWNCKSLS